MSPSAELSDALATAVYVMGIDAGMHLIDQLPATHAVIIDEKNEVSFSKKLDLVNET
jgi:thiamine biosynthesis lipoprotein